MKKIFFLIILLLYCDGLQAQQSIYFQGVIGQYSMADLKKMISAINNEYNLADFNTRKTLDFPATLHAEAGYMLRDNNVGVFINYSEAKSIIGYQDYSGYINDEFVVRRVLIGPIFELELTRNLSLLGKAGVAFNFLHMSFNTEVYGLELQSEEMNFVSAGIALTPVLQWQRPLGPVMLFINGGYELNFNGQTDFLDIDNAYLTDIEGSRIHINWSGLRFGAGISLDF